VKNVLEEAVAREYERLRAEMPDFCGCEMCRDDVLVFALNRLPPRYVTQPTGEVLTSVTMASDQPKADISVLLLEGFKRVQADPREGHG
jgi:competence protein ComFB